MESLSYSTAAISFFGLPDENDIPYVIELSQSDPLS